ncbi:MAG TPA: sigma-54 dependent transcriptional regulator [Candidatus Aquilonibacter sp.]|nr:sigma-54 dependent transcriptional regulator [Candidatus Aquilonibacter sp.]
MNRVLVVDDEPGMRAALEAHFIRRDWRVDTAANAAEAFEKFRRGMHPLVITDIRMPGADGFQVMRDARALAPHTAVILLTAYANVPDAVTAMKGGACDYLVKPVAFEQLEQAAERILAAARTRAEASDALVGHAPAWLRALGRASQAAASGADVLIEAESGTGKELLARLIHKLSSRCDRPLVAVNCSAFPETLLESELFGYARGAFTGATASKPGRFELANRGTLLLDEVGEMPLGLQPKLLRVLQEREFERLGDIRSVAVDVRVIATTNRSLLEMVRAGSFRADLYYRLNVIGLTLPPLRERREDIAELASHFLRLYASEGKTFSLTTHGIERLHAHSWPGNVRELANCLRRAVALASSGEIGPESLELAELESSEKLHHGRESVQSVSCSTQNLGTGPHRQKEIPSDSLEVLRAGVSLGDMERRLLEMTLEATGGNRSRAAGLLGVSLRTVRNKIRSYGLPEWSSYVHH